MSRRKDPLAGLPEMPNSRLHSLTLQCVQSMLEAAKYQYARSMPDNPHWYTLRKTWDNDQDFIDVVLWIRLNGITERWPPNLANGKKAPGARDYIYFYTNEWRYWTMGSTIAPGPRGPGNLTVLINRSKVEWEDF